MQLLLRRRENQHRSLQGNRLISHQTNHQTIHHPVLLLYHRKHYLLANHLVNQRSLLANRQVSHHRSQLRGMAW